MYAYKIRCNPTYPLYGVQPTSYVPVWVTHRRGHSALVIHQYTHVPPCCRILQYQSVAGTIAGEIMSFIYSAFVLPNRMNEEAQRILCGKSKKSYFYYFTKLKQGRIKMTFENKP